MYCATSVRAIGKRITVLSAMCQSGIAIFFPLLWPIPSVSSFPAAYVFSRSRATSFSVSSSSSSPSSQPEIHPKGIPMTFSWGREGEKMGWGWVRLKWDSIAQEVHSVLSLFPFPPLPQISSLQLFCSLSLSFIHPFVGGGEGKRESTERTS